jgi:tetratricopeptide (TPR) repeat protein
LGKTAMKVFLTIIFCVLICLSVQARIAEPLTSGIYSVNASLESPPYNVSVYISDAEAAVAGRNWTYALLLTTRGLAWYPADGDLFCLQGYTFRKLGQYAKSVDAVSEGIRRDPEPVMYANRGYGYLALRNYSAALSDAESGISLNASYPPAYAVKALALQGMGRGTDALVAIDAALARDPENAHYWHVKGVLLAAGGNCPGAREALAKSLALDPGYSLPYPDFAGARENLAALDITCPPATPGRSPAGSSAGGIAAVVVAITVVVFATRR